MNEIKMNSSKKRLKLAIVADEFFEREVTRMGGFGWAARQVANYFDSKPELGVEVIFLSATLRHPQRKLLDVIHNTTIVFAEKGSYAYLLSLKAKGIDLILSIDYRPWYTPLLDQLSPIPIIIWVRDPKTPEDRKKVATLSYPGKGTQKPVDTFTINTRSLAKFVVKCRAKGRTVLFATPAPTLKEKIVGAYAVQDSDCTFLPNIVDIRSDSSSKDARQKVVYLARLDAIKRPWLFVELAGHFPTVDFVMLGQSHNADVDNWWPKANPPNIKRLGHISGKEKARILSSASVLVNTSIHEGLAISFLEALACELPLLSCQDQEQVVSRFGIFIGRSDGDGLDSIPAFKEGLQTLLSDVSLRTKLGSQGCQWVRQTHNGDNFLNGFRQLCHAAKIQW